MINPIFSCYPLLFREDSGLIFKKKTHQTLVSRDFSEIIEKIYFSILISFSRFFHYRPVWWTLLLNRKILNSCCVQMTEVLYLDPVTKEEAKS